jgi:23S rRNA (adenine-N6)-dimethyltransferase
VGAHARAPRPSGRASDGQHFIRSARLANELVEQIGLSRRDLVVEIGAGTGSLTEPILQRARRVIAIEIDPACTRYLRERYEHDPRVDVVQANALRAPLPREPFRVVANLPFGSGTRILQRLLGDPSASLTHAHVLLQFEAARKLAQVAPSTLATLRWAPWWEFRLARRLSRQAFEPPPTVDAGLLAIERRRVQLLHPMDRPAFVRLLDAGFRRANAPLDLALHVDHRRWRDFAHERGLPAHAQAPALDVFDWTALFRITRRR